MSALPGPLVHVGLNYDHLIAQDGFGAYIYIPLDKVIGALSQHYVVISNSDLPEIETLNGNPKAPAQTQRERAKGPDQKAEFLRREALHNLALARWWELETGRREKRVKALAYEIGSGDPTRLADELARRLVNAGWRK